MKAAMKQKRLLMLGQIYLLMIECPKHDWHSAFGDKRLCYSRATAGTFILNLLYTVFVVLYNDSVCTQYLYILYEVKSFLFIISCKRDHFSQKIEMYSILFPITCLSDFLNGLGTDFLLHFVSSIYRPAIMVT